MGQSESRPAAYWDLVAAEWADGRHQIWRGVSDQVNARLLVRWLPPRVERLLKTDVFDEAVGLGVFPQLAARADNVFEMDVSPALLAGAAQQHPTLRPIAGDVRTLPFADESIDVIVSLSTLDHFATLDELVVSLKNLRRVLKPGGCLIVTLDNPLNPIIRLRNALPFEWLNRVGLVPYYVGITCTPKALARHLEEAGFRVVDHTPVLHVPRVLAVALARLLSRSRSERLHAVFTQAAFACEGLERLPTRYLSGHFLAIRAVAV